MKNIIIILVLSVLSGCAATKLNQEAVLVRLTHVEPNSDKCQFLGDITGNQEDLFTSTRNLETGARHDLKNQAHAMGGNVVYLLTQRAGQSGILIDDHGSSDQTSVTLSGNVYRCQE